MIIIENPGEYSLPVQESQAYAKQNVAQNYTEMIKNEEIHSSMGWAYYQNGDLVNSLHHYFKAYKLNPGNSSTTNNIGYFSYLLGDYENAEKFLKLTLELDHGSQLAQNNLAGVYNAKNQKKAEGRGGEAPGRAGGTSGLN
jgi:Flp pilus assembly protein TadD